MLVGCFPRMLWGWPRWARGSAFPGTYHLAFRDLPEIIGEHVKGRVALDFGCGTGRSTRFLKTLGFDTTGIDVARSMVERAQSADPSGSYRVIADGTSSALRGRTFDLILSAFPFDNIPGVEHRSALLAGLRSMLAPDGRIVILGSTPEVYRNEWASFTTKDFPENLTAKSGDCVRVMMKDVGDSRPVVDLLWTHEDYLALFLVARLRLIAHFTPLGRPTDPVRWLAESSIPPWVIYVLGPRM